MFSLFCRSRLFLKGVFLPKLHRHRPQIAFPKIKEHFLHFLHVRRVGGFYREFASVSREISWLRQPRAAQKRNHEGRQAGRQGGSGCQKQPRREIMKGDKLGRQGGSHSQEQPRKEIMEGDKLGRQGGNGSQEQPRRETMKGDKFGRQGGSGITTILQFRNSATQSLRSKNPYSFQLSVEKVCSVQIRITPFRKSVFLLKVSFCLVLAKPNLI